MNSLYHQLIHVALRPADPLTRAFADAMEASRGILPAERSDEYEELARLLLDYRSDDRDETAWLASAIAAACLGNNHLWQDLGLANRQELSDLMQNHFAALYARNSGNMKWKKFFYKQLCDRSGINACRAPSCAVCDDYQKCFGPEKENGLEEAAMNEII
jgi:nitrogen fixation protein NifQ